MSNLPAYRKTIVAVTAGVLGWAGVVVTSDAAQITSSEWLALAVAVATAAGVFATPNEPGEPG